MKRFTLYIYTVNQAEASVFSVEGASRQGVIDMVYANEKFYDYGDGKTTVRINISHIVKVIVKESQKPTAGGW